MTGLSSSLSSDCTALLLDASVVVNLNATGYADRILDALPMSTLVPSAVIRELKRGAAAGHTDAVDLQRLLDAGLAKEFKLPTTAQSEFVSLVSGPTSQSLGDGEAATIASAHTTSAWAAIDERKANKICAERYPHISVVNTIDIISYERVTCTLSKKALSDAILAALEVARMQVQPHQMDWVIAQVAPEKLQFCTSLPHSVRKHLAEQASSAKSNIANG